MVRTTAMTDASCAPNPSSCSANYCRPSPSATMTSLDGWFRVIYTGVINRTPHLSNQHRTTQLIQHPWCAVGLCGLR